MKDKNLSNEISQFYEALLEKVALIKNQTQKRISEIKKEQSQLAANLKDKLAKGESLRRADFDQMMATLIEKRKKRQQEVMEILCRFQKEEEEMAKGLKEFLGDGRRVRTKEFKKFLAGFKKRDEERKEDITEIRKAAEQIKKAANETIDRFTKEREEMAKEWQQLAVSMRKKRLVKKGKT